MSVRMTCRMHSRRDGKYVKNINEIRSITCRMLASLLRFAVSRRIVASALSFLSLCRLLHLLRQLSRAAANSVRLAYVVSGLDRWLL